MKTKPYAEAATRIETLLATYYKHPLANASAYLRAIYGTTIEDQKRLFAIILGRHNVTVYKESCDTPTKITETDFRMVAESIKDKIKGWVDDALSANKPLAETAAFIWDQLSLQVGQELTITLSLLLSPPIGLVPYAQVPDPPVVQPAECFATAHNSLSREIATLFRILSSSYSPAQKTTLIYQLIERCPKEVEKLVLLNVLTHFAANKHAMFVVLEPHLPPSPDEDPSE